jgi:hypothetical protein
MLNETKVASRVLVAVALMITLTTLAACGSYQPKEPAERAGEEGIWTDYENRNTVWGSGGLDLFGADQQNPNNALGVNSFLWRASLDTISFMPVSSADPFGGVIITDWHTPGETLDERFKLNVYILSRTLRADGVRVSVFRQVNNAGNWTDASVADGTGTRIEDAILTRARQLRHETLKTEK